MKKILIVIIIIIAFGIVSGISIYNSRKDNENTINQENENNMTAINTEVISNNDITSNNIVDNTEVSQSEGDNTNMENVRIKLTLNGNEIFVRLDDNQASRDFLAMLPITLTFEDFNNTEKIATLPNELSTEGLPSGYTPEVGDFAYYSPWGNISVFYKDFRYSSSLYKLGTIESGIEIFENINDNSEVIIEKVD